jgi:hypothetical protein
MEGLTLSLKRILRELPKNSVTSLVAAKKAKAASLDDVARAIRYAENLAQIRPLNDEQRKVLQKELYRLRFTPQELLERARWVAMNPEREFGNIGLRYWIAEPLDTVQSIQERVERRVRCILAEGMLRLKHPDAQEIGEQALARLHFEAEQEREKIYEEQLANYRKHLKETCDKIAAMTTKEREELYDKAVKKGIFTYNNGGQHDGFIIENMHKRFIAVELMELLD